MNYSIIAFYNIIPLLGSSVLSIAAQRSTVARIEPAKGPLGHPRGWKYCSADKWAIGFRLKVEQDQGRDDDTAMNAMELVCANVKKEGHEHIKEIEGYWGSWGSYSYCPSKGDFLSSVRFKIEPYQGPGTTQDDTGANDVQFKCSKSGKIINSTNGGKWGEWHSFESCPTGSAICGFSLIWEDKQGLVDDSAANGAIFDCCKLYPCLSSPCRNGGSCSSGLLASIFSRTGYRCSCAVGYEGPNCETKKDPCRSQPCKNGANCSRTWDGNDYSCTCDVVGFAGKNCDQPCTNEKKCFNGGLCENNMCHCKTGFEGTNCEIMSDPCRSVPCLNNGKCVQNGHSYRCICDRTGYQGDNCEKTCNNNKPCYHNATCNNNVCACSTAYEGPTCEISKLSCDRSPCKNGAVCLYNNSNLYCDCQHTGWQGKICDQPCINGLPCQNGGACNSSQCACKFPFSGPNCESRIVPTDVGKCNVWGDPHLKMFGQYPGAVRDQYICSDSGTFPLLVNRLINATITTTATHPWFISEYYLSFFDYTGKVLCSLSHLNSSGCDNNPIITVERSRRSLNIRYLNNYLRVSISSVTNRTASAEVKYYNIEIELDYYKIIGESIGLCVRPTDGCKFEIQSRRRKRDVNALRTVNPTIGERHISQSAEQICQLYVNETTKVIDKLNISMTALIDHYIIEDVLTSCIFDLQTTGNDELGASSTYIILSEGMAFLPPMDDTAYAAYWQQGLQLMNGVVEEVQKQMGQFF